MLVGRAPRCGHMFRDPQVLCAFVLLEVICYMAGFEYDVINRLTRGGIGFIFAFWTSEGFLDTCIQLYERQVEPYVVIALLSLILYCCGYPALSSLGHGLLGCSILEGGFLMSICFSRWKTLQPRLNRLQDYEKRILRID